MRKYKMCKRTFWLESLRHRIKVGHKSDISFVNFGSIKTGEVLSVRFGNEEYKFKQE